MIKVEVIEEFTLKDYYKLKNIQRKNKATEGRLFVGDTFECDEDMVKYLTGDNALKKEVVKIIEVIPEAKIEEFVTPLENKETLEKIKNEIVKNVKKTKKKRGK